LAETVVSKFPAAIRFENCYTARVQSFSRSNNAVGCGPPAERQSVRMLEQKQRVGLLPRQNVVCSLLLDPQPFAVFDPAKAFDFQNSLSHFNHRLDIRTESKTSAIEDKTANGSP
jgi:hypothetical protein